MSERTSSLGFYLAFDGIATRLATHPFSSSPYSLAGTYAAAIILDSLSGISRKLDHERGYIEDGGFSLRVMDTSTVRGLLRRRGGTETQLATAITASGTTITLSSGTNTYANSSRIYLDRETITLGTHTGSGTYTGCTRGVDADAGVGVPHDAAAVISDVPRHWYTRRATLYAVDVETSPATATAIWYGSLSSSPSFKDGAWDLEFTGRMNELLNRPVLTGFREVIVSSASATPGAVELTLPGGGQYDIAPGGYGGLLRVDGHQGTGFYFFDDSVLVSDTLTLNPRQLRWGDPPGILDAEPGGVRLRQVALVEGGLAIQALQVMLSDVGDGTGSSYDILPGRAPNTSGAANGYVRRRTGAGLVWDVDVESGSWLTMDTGLYNGATWIDEPTRLGDFLVDNILWRSGGYAYIDATGKLSWKRYAPSSIRGALTTYDMGSASLLSSVVTVDDETGAIGNAQIECNYDPIERRYDYRLEVVFVGDAELFGERVGQVSHQTKGVNIYTARPTIGVGDSLTAIESYFDRIRARVGVGGRRTTIRVPWRHVSTFVPGYRFALTDSRLPTHDSATLGVTARAYEVVGQEIDFGDQTATLECDELPTGHIIGAAAEVSSWDGGTLTATLSTGATVLGGGTMFTSNPGQKYNVGATARIYDASANPPFSATGTSTIASKANGTITVSGAFSGGITPAAGDIITQDDGADTSALNDLSADVQDVAYGGDSSYLIGTGTGYERAATRWT